MTWVAAAVIGSSVIGGIASDKAASKQAAAAGNATAAQLEMFNTVNDQQEPWRQAGRTALSQLTDLTQAGGPMSHTFNADDLKSNLAPNYDFMLNQGIGQVNNQNNATGGIVSGNATQAATKFAEDYAGNAYQNAFNNYQTQQSNIFNRLSTIAGLGSTANAQSTSAASAMSPGIADSIIGGGNARAAGDIGVANAFKGGVNDFLGYRTSNNNSDPGFDYGVS
jgi:hypothetical protein